MLNRLLQAVLITSAMYLIMLCSRFPAQLSLSTVDRLDRIAGSAVIVTNLEDLFAEMLSLLLQPVQRDA
jgi:hypothetical protein